MHSDSHSLDFSGSGWVRHSAVLLRALRGPPSQWTTLAGNLACPLSLPPWRDLSWTQTVSLLSESPASTNSAWYALQTSEWQNKWGSETFVDFQTRSYFFGAFKELTPFSLRQSQTGGILRNLWCSGKKWHHTLWKTEPDQRARCREGALGSLGEWLEYSDHRSYLKWIRLPCQAANTPKWISHPKPGTQRAGRAEDLPAQQTFSDSQCDSSHRPPVTLPKKYQPLPPQPESSRSPLPQRLSFPDVQKGPRWQVWCGCWWNAQGGWWAREGEEDNRGLRKQVPYCAGRRQWCLEGKYP